LSTEWTLNRGTIFHHDNRIESDFLLIRTAR
jgi:hypothetical protein